MEGLWQGFRSRRGWVQVLGWLFAPPLLAALFLWRWPRAGSRIGKVLAVTALILGVGTYASAFAGTNTAPHAVSPRQAAPAAMHTPPDPAPTCHPSYVGACLPLDAPDVDCAGGGGNGPVYVQEKNFLVVGPDVYKLDADGDGIACESR